VLDGFMQKKRNQKWDIFMMKMEILKKKLRLFIFNKTIPKNKYIYLFDTVKINVFIYLNLINI